METFNAILTRRSIRHYNDRELSKEIIDKLLKSAMFAPSAMNLQPWHFVVVEDKKVLNGTLKAIPYAEMLKQANIAILVCGDINVEKNEDFIVQNCSAATQNILLAAHDFGLGAVWIGIHPMKEIMEPVSEYFNLPEHIIPVSMVSIGYPAEKVEAENRFNKEKIHLNKW